MGRWFSLVVRAECLHAGDPGSNPWQGCLYTFGCIPPAPWAFLGWICAIYKSTPFFNFTTAVGRFLSDNANHRISFFKINTGLIWSKIITRVAGMGYLFSKICMTKVTYPLAVLAVEDSLGITNLYELAVHLSSLRYYLSYFAMLLLTERPMQCGWATHEDYNILRICSHGSQEELLRCQRNQHRHDLSTT
jgi:hypothetical protein